MCKLYVNEAMHPTETLKKNAVHVLHVGSGSYTFKQNSKGCKEHLVKLMQKSFNDY